MKRSMSYPAQLLLSSNVGRATSPDSKLTRRKSLFQKWNTIRVSNWPCSDFWVFYSCARARCVAALTSRLVVGSISSHRVRQMCNAQWSSTRRTNCVERRADE